MRYPGAKTRMLPVILENIPADVERFCEPFAGSLAVTLAVVRRPQIKTVFINDADPGIVALWQAVVYQPEKLVERVDSYQPRPQDFYTFRDEPSTGDVLTDGFRKLVLHQISYSGLGAMAGSPIGGREQNGHYDVECRWNARQLADWIRRAVALLRRVEVQITCTDANEACRPDAFVYADPPYYKVGDSLYTKRIDHDRLAVTLKNHPAWVLSYDDCPEVRALYAWAYISLTRVRSHLHHRHIDDVLITPVPARHGVQGELFESCSTDNTYLH